LADRLPTTDPDADYLDLSAAVRVTLVWPLTVKAWSIILAARGEHFDPESRLRRDIVSVQRRGR
jgi:hypothetical protein